MKTTDFVALETALWASMVRDTEGPTPEPETMWQPAYIQAIEKAILMDDYSELVLLMKEKQPIHPMLLPALADAISARGRHKASGNKRKLTDTQAQNVARAIQYLRRTGKSSEVAYEEVAARYSISDKTAKRAYLTHIPDYMRPALNRR